MSRLAFAVAVLIGALASSTARAQDAPLFDAQPVNEADLAEQRGGFELPGGIQLSLSAVITTNVDGARLLQTVLTIDDQGAKATSTMLDGATTTLDAHGATVMAQLPGLTVEHVVGDRIASLVANSGDNRVIDHDVSINMSLSNVQPLTLGSAVFRVQALGIDSGIWRSMGG